MGLNKLCGQLDCSRLYACSAVSHNFNAQKVATSALDLSKVMSLELKPQLDVSSCLTRSTSAALTAAFHVEK